MKFSSDDFPSSSSSAARVDFETNHRSRSSARSVGHPSQNVVPSVPTSTSLNSGSSSNSSSSADRDDRGRTGLGHADDAGKKISSSSGVRGWEKARAESSSTSNAASQIPVVVIGKETGLEKGGESAAGRNGGGSVNPHEGVGRGGGLVVVSESGREGGGRGSMLSGSAPYRNSASSGRRGKSLLCCRRARKGLGCVGEGEESVLACDDNIPTDLAFVKCCKRWILQFIFVRPERLPLHVSSLRLKGTNQSCLTPSCCLTH